jgi:ethanolamine ammonia-lyase small subunit
VRRDIDCWRNSKAHWKRDVGEELTSLDAVLEKIRHRTPARVFVGRTGAGYLTRTQLELREGQAAAADAVRAEFDLDRALGSKLIKEFGIFEVQTAATSKEEYIRNPALGRRFGESARQQILRLCPSEPDLQIIIGDGLSIAALGAQVPALLPRIMGLAQSKGWTLGQPFAIRYCRVGILNEVGELLRPKVAVLLIGERPGLATDKSLSAYLAFRPRAGHTDSDRNVISNIHKRGVDHEQAALRIVNLAARLMASGRSGSEIKEDPPQELPSRGDPHLR